MPRPPDDCGSHDRWGRPWTVDRLLTAALYDNLPLDEAAAAERQILHDDDPAGALAALSRDAALVVAAAGEMGETVKRLAALAGCPVAVVPAVAPTAPLCSV